jgi:hypothetical protein
MKTKLASAFGLAMLCVVFSFSTSFACPETSQTTASAVESTVSESGMSVTALAEASAPEGQVVEVGAPASVARNIETPSTEPSAPSADAISVEITETVTIVVPGQNSEAEEAPAVPAGIAGTEPSVTEDSPQSGAKSTADLSVQTGASEAQIVDEPAATSNDVNAPAAILSLDAVPVEITVTVTVVVPGQTSEAIDEVEITAPQPEHPISAPNLKRDEATAALDDGE